MRLSPNPRPPPLQPCPDCARGCTPSPLRLASRALRSPAPSRHAFLFAGSKSRHLDRDSCDSSALEPMSNPTTTGPILPQPSQSTLYSSYPSSGAVAERSASVTSTASDDRKAILCRPIHRWAHEPNRGVAGGCRTAVGAVQAASRLGRRATALRVTRRCPSDAVHPWRCRSTRWPSPSGSTARRSATARWSGVPATGGHWRRRAAQSSRPSTAWARYVRIRNDAAGERRVPARRRGIGNRGDLRCCPRQRDRDRKVRQPEIVRGLATNAFGFFLHEAAAELLPHPDCEGEAWPAGTLNPEAELVLRGRPGRIRFPIAWRRRHRRSHEPLGPARVRSFRNRPKMARISASMARSAGMRISTIKVATARPKTIVIAIGTRNWA